jgi:tetratricopeptide (TPR) repeat protein
MLDFMVTDAFASPFDTLVVHVKGQDTELDLSLEVQDHDAMIASFRGQLQAIFDQKWGLSDFEVEQLRFFFRDAQLTQTLSAKGKDAEEPRLRSLTNRIDFNDPPRSTVNLDLNERHRLLMKQAFLAMEQRRHATAEQECLFALRLPEGREQILPLLATARRSQGRWALAEEAFRQWFALEKDNTSALLGRGEMYLVQHLWQQAEEVFQIVLSFNRKSIHGLVGLAQAQYHLRKKWLDSLRKAYFLDRTTTIAFVQTNFDFRLAEDNAMLSSWTLEEIARFTQIPKERLLKYCLLGMMPLRGDLTALPRCSERELQAVMSALIMMNLESRLPEAPSSSVEVQEELPDLHLGSRDST